MVNTRCCRLSSQRCTTSPTRTASPRHQSLRGRRDVRLIPSLSCCMLKPPTTCRLSTVKTHQSAVIAKELEISARETAVAEREANLTTLVAEKGGEIPRVSRAQYQLDTRMREVIGKRGEELWVKGSTGRRSLLRWGDVRIKFCPRCGNTSRIYSTHGVCGRNTSKRRQRPLLRRGCNG